MIKLTDLSVQADDFFLGPIDLEVSLGEYVVISGSSGSGKTTLLEAIAGLRKPLGGSIILGGIEVTRYRPADRHVAYVPQDCVLFQSMSVKRNVLFGMKIRGFSKLECAATLATLTRLFSIGPLMDRSPGSLSGGERQRVAMARAMATSPDILLMDEPFAALDAPLRAQMIQVMSQIKQQRDCTILHVSHHSIDAQNLADRVIEIGDGRVKDDQFIGRDKDYGLPQAIRKRVNWEAPDS